MEFLEMILFPLIYVLESVLMVLQSLTGSYGVSIILLSVFVAIFTYPLAIHALKMEIKDNQLHQMMAPRIQYAKANFKGETRFIEIEKIYKEHKYHPIHSVKSAASFILQLPFLLSWPSTVSQITTFPVANTQLPPAWTVQKWSAGW